MAYFDLLKFTVEFFEENNLDKSVEFPNELYIKELREKSAPFETDEEVIDQLDEELIEEMESMYCDQANWNLVDFIDQFVLRDDCVIVEDDYEDMFEMNMTTPKEKILEFLSEWRDFTYNDMIYDFTKAQWVGYLIEYYGMTIEEIRTHTKARREETGYRFKLLGCSCGEVNKEIQNCTEEMMEDLEGWMCNGCVKEMKKEKKKWKSCKECGAMCKETTCIMCVVTEQMRKAYFS